ncbi:kinase-like protein [Cylindrobasidium torrendii FP15055 ss-10]|uniref:Kinase-like protein n=1 Tax=Cylindrobasidium torrendii FP15055 ss-10 TaxID=1314674 RepID=A0A0D7BD68_9AGAR|nr:kinase-like protein [Cylindrobasidium torrendii FP15055 ss-10]
MPPRAANPQNGPVNDEGKKNRRKRAAVDMEVGERRAQPARGVKGKGVVNTRTQLQGKKTAAGPPKKTTKSKTNGPPAKKTKTTHVVPDSTVSDAEPESDAIVGDGAALLALMSPSISTVSRRPKVANVPAPPNGATSVMTTIHILSDNSTVPDSLAGSQGQVDPGSRRESLSLSGPPSNTGAEKSDSEAGVVEPAGPGDFTLLRVLGNQDAAKSFLARKKGSDALFVLKSFNKSVVVREQLVDNVVTQQEILKYLASARSKHPFVAELKRSFQSPTHLFLVLDFYPGGNLRTVLTWQKTVLDPKLAKFYLREIVEGLTSLHRERIVHRDVRPENILIDRDGHIVISGFDLAKQLRESSELFAVKPGNSAAPIALECMAPELIKYKSYAYSVDYWALGVIAYEMTTGLRPLYQKTFQDAARFIMGSDELVFPKEFQAGADAEAFIRTLLHQDASKRPSELNIKNHAYFAQEGAASWDEVRTKAIIPPYVPDVDPSVLNDTQNLSQESLNMDSGLDVANEEFDDYDYDPEGELQLSTMSSFISDDAISGNDVSRTSVSI